MKEDGQYNGQKKKDKAKNNDLQNITYKTKDRVTRTPQKTGGELRWSGSDDYGLLCRSWNNITPMCFFLTAVK